MYLDLCRPEMAIDLAVEKAITADYLTDSA